MIATGSAAGFTAGTSSTGTALPRVDVTRHELCNGLQVLIQRDFSAPLVSLQYWVATGSIHEGRWLGTGLSHLAEHLMFKGTPTRGNSAMAQEIHDLGGHLNAYTSFDRTVYHVDLPSENWKSALDILSDSVTQSSMPEEEFEKEKEVIRREFAMGRDNPDRELGKLIFQTAFVRHPYRHPIIGHLDLFNQLTRDDVRAYYKQRYSIQNMTLIICGAVEPAEAIAEIERRCGEIERTPLDDVFLPEEPAQLVPRSETRSFATPLTRLAIAHPIPGLHHDDIPALDVLAILLGEGRSSRLHQSAVEKSGLAEEVDAFAYAPAQIGLWGVEARCQPDKADALIAHIHDEFQRLKNEPPHPDEVDRAKRMSLLGQLRSMKTMSGKAASLGRGWLLDHDPHFSEHYLAKLQQVTAEEVHAVAQRYVRATTENIVRVEAAAAETTSAEIATPVPAPSAKLEKSELPGGLRLISRHSPELPLFTLRAVLPAGMVDEPVGKSGLNRLTSQLLIKGTRKRSAEQLARDIEQIGGVFGADSGNNSSTCALELLASDWRQGLDILSEILTEPSFTADELATEKRKQIADIHAERDHPMALARDIVRATLYPGHPYATPPTGTPQDVEALTLDDVQSFAKEHVLTQRLILCAAGQVDAGWTAAIAERLAGLPAGSETTCSPFALSLDGPQRLERHADKEQAVLQVAFAAKPVNDPENLPLAVLDEALSDLGSRFFIRIREELGLAYFVGTSQFLGTAAGHFFFYVGTDPKQRADVEKALHEEIRHVATGGITATEFERAKAKMLSREIIQDQNPATVAYAASLDELFGLGYDFALARRERLRSMTLDDVNHAARRVLDTENHLTVIVSPL